MGRVGELRLVRLRKKVGCWLFQECAGARTKTNAKAEPRQRRRKFQISDLRFQIEETANANTNTNTNANANANADPSPLKGIRDDGVVLFFAEWDAGTRTFRRDDGARIDGLACRC